MKDARFLVFGKWWRLVCQLLCLACLGLAPATHASGPPPSLDGVVLSHGANTTRVGEGVEYFLEKPGEALTRAQVLQPGMAGRWVRHVGSKINFPSQSAPVWLRFAVHNRTGADAQWVLRAEWPMLRNIDFELADLGSPSPRSVLQIDVRKPTPQFVAKSPSHLFPVAIEAGKSATVLMRIDTDVYTLPMSLWEREAIKASLHDNAALTGALFGVLGVMLLYNLSLFVFTRDRNYLDYLIYLGTVMLFEASYTGYGNLYLWPDNVWLKKEAFPLFGSLAYLGAAWFISRFLEMKTGPRHLYLTMRAFMAFWMLAIPLLFIVERGPLLDGALRTVGLVEALFIVYAVVLLSVRGSTAARYCAVGWITLVLTHLVNGLWVFGVIEGNWFIQNAQHIGFVIEIVALSVALAERIRRERESREAAQLQALDMTQRMESERELKLQAQEHALTVQRQANEELEQRVQERTYALELAMQSLENANAELATMSITDGLTKIHNRRYFDDVLDKEFDRTARLGLPLTLLLLDIDHFKRINDTVGHVGGDECLKLVAHALSSSLSRMDDMVARYGGEEFAVVLPSVLPSQAPEIAERLRAAVESVQFIYRGQRVPLNVSVGVVSEVPCTSRGKAGFIARADKALYRAKHAGRNCVKVAAADGQEFAASTV